MKFIPNKTAEEQIEDNINQAKQILKRKQFPSKHAPKLEPSLLITICGCTFKVHRQDKELLVLKADETINFENNVNVLRSVSYIVGARPHVSIEGWDWRPTRYKKNKIYLRPVAPSNI